MNTFEMTLIGEHFAPQALATSQSTPTLAYYYYYGPR